MFLGSDKGWDVVTVRSVGYGGGELRGARGNILGRWFGVFGCKRKSRLEERAGF